MRTAEQLREVFNVTFDALPLTVRSKIEVLWHKNGVEREGGNDSGHFIIPIVKQATLASRSQAAQTDGIFFFFKAAVADLAPDDVLKILMAHELAHAHRLAEVGCPLPEASLILGTTAEAVQREEAAANALVAQWGYDRNALLLWLQANEVALDL